MRGLIKGAAFVAVILLAAGPAVAEEMNNLKLDDLHQIELEQAKMAGAAPSQAETPPATTAPAQ